MTGRELFLLHPVAWSHANNVLETEAEMAKVGQSAAARLEFLRTQLPLLVDQAEVTMPEIWTELFNAMNRADFVYNIDVMRSRFETFGFGGTLRQLRALERSTGNNAPYPDQLTFWGGWIVLAEDEDFGVLVRGAFGPSLDLLLSQPEFTNSEAEYERIQAERLLPSQKETRSLELAYGVFSNMLSTKPHLFEFSDDQVRACVAIRSRILDLRLTDILLALVQRGAIAEVRLALQQSISRSVEHYRYVVRLVLGQRMAVLSRSQTQNNDTEVEQNRHRSGTEEAQVRHQSGTEEEAAGIEHRSKSLSTHSDPELLTTTQVLAILKVSRSTLHNLQTQGVLIPIKVGRSNRYSKADIERFLDIR